MKLDRYHQTKICTTEKEFDSAVNDIDFYDFHLVGKDAVICLKDGAILSHSNLPSVSSRWVQTDRSTD